MLPSALPPLAVLIDRFSDPDDPRIITTVSFPSARQAGTDPGGILPYLARFGRSPACLDDLLACVNALPDEEELHAWPVQEGIAVSIASDGAWFLFTP